MFGATPTVLITCKSDGTVQIDVVGATGPGCLKLTDKIRDKLSNCTIDEKAEIHETSVDTTITQGLG